MCALQYTVVIKASFKTFWKHVIIETNTIMFLILTQKALCIVPCSCKCIIMYVLCPSAGMKVCTNCMSMYLCICMCYVYAWVLLLHRTPFEIELWEYNNTSGNRMLGCAVLPLAELFTSQYTQLQVNTTLPTVQQYNILTTHIYIYVYAYTYIYSYICLCINIIAVSERKDADSFKCIYT